ncbi:MAG: hypothetical protein U9O20_02825 [Patescibacteria group bacterium]|nr:hypothetical protein [Patescibacteria group bacterium]
MVITTVLTLLTPITLDTVERLDRDLSKDIKLTEKKDHKSETMLSITEEKYRNMINHIGLIIRPKEISNVV